MRDLKFRMLTQTTDKILGYVDIYDLLRDGSDVLPDFDEAVLEGVKFEQYTGLKDKNGKEIYEGDIVVPVSDLGHRYMEDRGVVKFGAVESFEEDIEYQCWYSEGKYDGRPLVVVLEDRPKGYEVIGNVHENKELLDD